MSPPRAYYELSEDDGEGLHGEGGNKKRSSRACDQCRKTKSKCERTVPDDDSIPCKACVQNNTPCTFLGPSYKRGPPKGYIHAIEQRWHHVESVLGAILASHDPRAQGIIADLRQDDLAREILNRVDAGPFGPAGKLPTRGRTKEDYMASIIRSEQAGRSATREGRSRRQSRVSREIVSSNQDVAPLPAPTVEWQDRLSAQLGRSSASPSHNHSPQRRRLNGLHPDWDAMYTMEGSDGNSERGEDDNEEDMNAVAMGQLSLDENSEVRYHGKASGLHLLARRTNSQKDGGIWKLPMVGVWPPSDLRPTRLLDEDDIQVPFPTQDDQDNLVHLYFTYVHPTFPIVHKQHFLEEYERRKAGSPILETHGSRSGTPSGVQVSKVLLLAMFALASRYGDPPHDHPVGRMWEIGCQYVLDAREVLNKIYHHSRPSTVQAMLLIGLHEFGVGSMEHGWLFIGMAIRMAEDLGLNRASDKWQYQGVDIFTPVENQIRKLIWWGCCFADIFVSVYMGRPLAISESDHDTNMPDLPENDLELWQPHILDPSKPRYHPVPARIAECFRISSQLVVIFSEIVKKIYPVRNVTGIPRRQQLAEIESRLDKWYIDLPEVFRYDSARTRHTIPPPHVLLLHVRYWSAVLLLHRAFIPRSNGSVTPRGQSDFDTVSLKAFDLCQSAASHISSIVTAYEEHFGLNRAPLFLSSYILSSGIMHVATLNLRGNNVQASLGLRQCLAALEKMETIWPSASRAKELLQGANVNYHGNLTPLESAPARHKRPAEELLENGKTSEFLQREVLSSGVLEKAPSPPGASDSETQLMAHMLGLEIPGVQASTSYFPGYEWWPSIPSMHSQAGRHPPLAGLVDPSTQPRTNGNAMYAQTAPAPDWLANLPSPQSGYPYETTSGYEYGR